MRRARRKERRNRWQRTIENVLKLNQQIFRQNVLLCWAPVSVMSPNLPDAGAFAFVCTKSWIEFLPVFYIYSSSSSEWQLFFRQP